MTTFGFKIRTRFGTWNVRTLLETTKLAQASKIMKSYRLELLGITEIRWPDQGMSTTPDGGIIIYSGRPASEHRRSGVGIMLSKKLKNSLIDWQPISDRIICLRLRGKARNISFINCYAPTEPSQYEDKEEFYEKLTETLDKIRKGDIIVLMGDFNAQVGSNNANVERVMGCHGLGGRNINGDFFIELCQKYNLVIGGTIFPHRHIHKITWTSPDGKTENQIDHIAISGRWRSSLLDVRNKRGADIGSDHHLLIGEIRFKLKSPRSKYINARQEKYNFSKLDHPKILRTYQNAIREKITLPELQNVDQEIEAKWKHLRDLMCNTTKEILGNSTIKKSSFISEETWEEIKKRSEAKKQILTARTPEEKKTVTAKYSQINKNVKKLARRDKRIWADNLAATAEEAAQTQKTRDLYTIARKITNKSYPSSRPLRDKQGLLLTTPDQQLQRWEEHFQEVLNCTLETDPIVEASCRPALNINTEHPSSSEIKGAIKRLKNNKSPGPDNIFAEMLKVNVSVIVPHIYNILKEVWTTGKIPNKWKEGIIVKLPKKGDLSNCGNWRGITLLNNISKILAQILHARIAEVMEPKLRREQAGFRPLKSCTDHINTLRIIVEQTVEWQTPLYMAFIDFQRAFDSLQHEALWKILELIGIPGKIISIIKDLYSGATCVVKHEGKLTKQISIVAGVKQGCPLSPLLFNLALDWVMKKSKPNMNGIRWDLQNQLGDLDYADDICLLAHSQTDIQNQLDRLSKFAKLAGLHINVRKTKAMRIGTSNTAKLYIYGKEIEEVDEFCYLGSMITKDGGANSDINQRIAKARQAFGMLNTIWRSSQITRRTKIRLFNSNVKAVLLYGCETWKVTKANTEKLQVFVNKCLRKIAKIKWTDRVTNTDLWERTKQQPLDNEIRSRKWGWIGHVLRRSQDDITKMSLEWNPQGKRKTGRPKTTWRRSMIAEARKAGKSWQEIKKLASNRVRWRQFVEALCSS